MEIKTPEKFSMKEGVEENEAICKAGVNKKTFLFLAFTKAINSCPQQLLCHSRVLHRRKGFIKCTEELNLYSPLPSLSACTCLRGSLDLFRFHWKGFQTLYSWEQPICALQTSTKKEEERMSRFIPIHLNSPQLNYIKPQILLLPIKRRGQDCSVHFLHLAVVEAHSTLKLSKYPVKFLAHVK